MNITIHFLIEGECACGNEWPCDVRTEILKQWTDNVRRNSAVGYSGVSKGIYVVDGEPALSEYHKQEVK